MDIEIDQDKFLTYLKIFMPVYWIPKLGSWWRRVYMERMVYRLEEHCLVQERGVFLYSKKRVAYAGIREASVYRGPILQLFGGSIVVVHTAGQNQGWPEASIPCPADPEGLVEEITRRVVGAKAETGKVDSG